MTEKKKGIPTLALVGGGCLILVVIAMVAIGILAKKGFDWVKEKADNPAKVVAELAIRNDPNLEVVSSDDRGGTITFRDKRTGKETTVDWDRFKDGKLVVTTDGEVTTMELKDGKARIEGPAGTTTFEAGGGLEKLPKWFTVPEGIAGWKSSARHEEEGGRQAGLIAGESGNGMEELIAAFEKNLLEAGFTRTAKTELTDRAVLHFEDLARQRNLSITIVRQEGKSGVTIAYDGR